ncbi:MAG TPA: ABC transporter substrate-binding protein, partial [Solirubrobacterales bacterium]|nr:ABC transporter substrate-binding protein [Solirubrobacterales bacterium]
IPNTENIYVTSNGSAYDPPDEAMAKLFENLQRAGVETDVSSALLAAYAAGQLMLGAIEETGSVDGNVLADALEARPRATIMGRVSYTKADHFPTETRWPVYVYSNGKPKLVTRVEARFIPKYGE